MTNVTSESNLSPARARLLQNMHDNAFGRILGLSVRQGEPVFDPPPMVKRSHRFGRGAESYRPDQRQMRELKRDVVELFAIFDREASMVIEELKFEDGLPVSMIVIAKDRA